MTKITVRAVLAAVTAAFVLLGQPVDVSAGGDYPPQECVLSVSNPQPAAGETFTVTATSNDEGGTITFTFNGEIKMATVTGGKATVTLTGPAPGNYTGTAVCGDESADFIVSVPTPEVPPTGSDATQSGLLLGTGLFGLGAAMVLVAHRRRRQPALA